MFISKNVLASTVLLALSTLTACGGGGSSSKATLVVGSEHLYSRMVAGQASEKAIVGTYSVSGTFAGAASDGGKVTIEEGKYPGQLVAKRTSSSGALTAVGRVGIIGDQVYVGWELAPPNILNGQVMVKLYVADVTPTAFEGFTSEYGNRPFSGGYGTTPAPDKLAVGDTGKYSMAIEDVTHKVYSARVVLKRNDDQFMALVTDSLGGAMFGTGLLTEQRMAMAVISDSQTDVPQLSVGIYTLSGSDLSGNSATSDAETGSRPNGGAMITLRSPREPEQWKRDGGATP